MITKTKTLTDLNNYYKFLNADPLTFNGMYLSCMETDASLCGDDNIWSDYNMPLSRERLAQIVQRTEQEIAEILGTPVKPQWIREEVEIPLNWKGKSVFDLIFHSGYRFIKRVGQQRLKKVLDGIDITYQDIDMDGFHEQATINFTLPVDENLCDIKLYFGETEHEITGFTIKSYNEDTREVELLVDSWLLIDPSLYHFRTFIRNAKALDGCVDDSFISTVDIWVDTVDSCKPSIEFVFDDTHICTGTCQQSKQPGCATVINSCEGTFKVRPQTYDEDDCVTNGNWNICGRPSKIIFYYQAGCHTSSCLDKCNTDCFCANLEEIVFKVATARYPFPTCDCPCVSSVMKTYAQQTSLIVKNEGRTFRYSQKYVDNAIFGSTVGEIEGAVSLLLLKEQFCNYEM